MFAEIVLCDELLFSLFSHLVCNTGPVPAGSRSGSDGGRPGECSAEAGSQDRGPAVGTDSGPPGDSRSTRAEGVVAQGEALFLQDINQSVRSEAVARVTMT